ncbi:MAG: hypothetical protein ACYCVH_12900 [Ignavibacteriaceae bacterium]
MKFYLLSIYFAFGLMIINVSAQTKNGLMIPHDSVANTFQNKNNFNEEKPVYPEDNKSFFFAGSSIGTPGGISLNAGYFFKHFSLKISGGYWKKDWYGFQGDLGFVFSNTGKLIQGISLVGGMFDAIRLNDSGAVLSPVQQTYLGVTYDAYYSGFYLQTGLGFGLHNYPSNPQLLFQFGYLFRL